jgi:hypothetical protein
VAGSFSNRNSGRFGMSGARPHKLLKISVEICATMAATEKDHPGKIEILGLSIPKDFHQNSLMI